MCSLQAFSVYFTKMRRHDIRSIDDERNASAWSKTGGWQILWRASQLRGRAGLLACSSSSILRVGLKCAFEDNFVAKPSKRASRCSVCFVLSGPYQGCVPWKVQSAKH